MQKIKNMIKIEMNLYFFFKLNEMDAINLIILCKKKYFFFGNKKNIKNWLGRIIFFFFDSLKLMYINLY